MNIQLSELYKFHSNNETNACWLAYRNIDTDCETSPVRKICIETTFQSHKLFILKHSSAVDAFVMQTYLAGWLAGCLAAAAWCFASALFSHIPTFSVCLNQLLPVLPVVHSMGLKSLSNKNGNMSKKFRHSSWKTSKRFSGGRAVELEEGMKNPAFHQIITTGIDRVPPHASDWWKVFLRCFRHRLRVSKLNTDHLVWRTGWLLYNGGCRVFEPIGGEDLTSWCWICLYWRNYNNNLLQMYWKNL